MENPLKPTLSETLGSLKGLSKAGDHPFQVIIDTLEARGFGILLVCLSLPSALPVPAPGYSTPFGIVLFLLALQIMRGRDNPVLPGRAARAKLSGRVLHKMADASSWFFRKTEWLIRPRLGWMHRGPGRFWLGLLVGLMALLMCLPIPTTNTFPAMVIFLIGVSFSEEDGLFGIFAGLLGIFAVLLYAFVLYLAFHLVAEYGWSGLEQLKEVIKEAIGLGQPPTS